MLRKREHCAGGRALRCKRSFDSGLWKRLFVQTLGRVMLAHLVIRPMLEALQQHTMARGARTPNRPRPFDCVLEDPRQP